MISITIISMWIWTAQSIVALLTIGFLVSWWLVLAIWGGGAIIFICIVAFGKCFERTMIIIYRIWVILRLKITRMQDENIRC